MALPKMTKRTNLEWYQQVWANASDEFKDRVPKPTQETLEKFSTAVLDTNYPELLNEFTNTFVRIGRVYVDMYKAYNPLEMLIGETIEYGGVIQELYVDVQQAYQFDPEGTHAFKKADNSILSEYLIKDVDMTYKVTISYEQARTAFTSEGQMQSLFSAIVAQLYESRQHDLYIMLKQVIAAYQGYGEPVTIKPIVKGSETTDADAKAALLEIKLAINRLRFDSRNYNNRGVLTHTPTEDLFLLIRADYDALLDVEYLAGVFNLDKTSLEARKIVVDDFGGALTVPFLLIDRRAIQVHLYPEFARNEFNADGGFYNYYNSLRGIIAISRFRNMLMFTYAAPVSVSFDANGGVGTMKPIYVPYVEGKTSIIVPGNEFTPLTGKQFVGWGLTAGATTPDLYAGQTYNITSATPVTLYALWGNLVVG